MKKTIYKLVVVILILVLAAGSCRKAGEWLVKADEPEYADAMIMLMGSISDRVLETADLYHARVAGKVWIVKEGMGASRMLEERGVQITSTTTQVRRALVELGIPADRIVILPGGATSTQMEAEIVRDYLFTLEGIDTLLVVSSSHHTRRANMIFKAALSTQEEPISVMCSPSRYTDFNAGKWWKSREDIQDVVLEYLKITNFVLFEKRKLK
ncbi:MAG: YdcF family protein [Bacteroidetes bacterium]|nr:YdcF family protein [Bacteroidota bacterium]